MRSSWFKLLVAPLLAALIGSAVAIAPAQATEEQIELAVPAEASAEGKGGAKQDTKAGYLPARMVNGRACPTRAFDIGDGWGADRGRRSHKGLDLSAKRGTPIYAVESGRINRTKKQSNGALQIVLKGKRGPKYYYGHMDKVFVKTGQRVRAGQVIGLMGDTGSPGAVHLHFEFWKSGLESAAINPAKLVRKLCR